jgi:hypothetical protein
LAIHFVLKMNKILVSKSRCCDNFGPGISIPKKIARIPGHRDPGIACYNSETILIDRKIKIQYFHICYTSVNDLNGVVVSNADC